MAKMLEDTRNCLTWFPCEYPWWVGSFDGVFIPFAITGEALGYYAGLSQALREGHPEAYGTQPWKRSSFSYFAEVEHHELFEYENERFANVAVVKMKLGWSSWSGNLCALGFGGKRLVVFDGGVAFRPRKSYHEAVSAVKGIAGWRGGLG
jgi:hypothetical protein